ncbi:MAG TPA: hypothetical protein VKY24_12090 [Reyranella sp.]|jgi:hypothetical protein|nr:hypothetical protein [Reyranella sp.]
MQRLGLALSLAVLVLAGTAFAQSSSSSSGSDAPSSFYPAPPPKNAPEVDTGAPVNNLTSPLAADQVKPTRTAIDSEAEAEMFSHASRIVWGRYSRIKGAKPGAAVVTKGALWTVKGKLDSVAPGTEGDWTSIDAVVERISPNHITVRGEVAFRVAKVQNGTPCKVAGVLHFHRSGKSQVWRLAEGDNPCDGSQEFFDLVYEKAPVEKKPVPKKG